MLYLLAAYAVSASSRGFTRSLPTVLMPYPLQMTYLLAPGCPTCWLLMPYLLAADTLRPTR